MKELKGYRKEIYSILKKSKNPMLAKDVLSEMSIKPDLSTVYRGLEYLVKNNFVSFIAFFDNTRLFYSSDSPHNHFIYCLKCHKVENFEECIIGEFQNKIETKFDYKVKEHFLYFTGLCKECRELN